MTIEESHPLTADSEHPLPVRLLQPHLNGLVAAFAAPAMCLSAADGQIRRGGVAGFWVQDRRAISELVLSVDGDEPTFLSRALVGGAGNRFEGACFNLGSATPDPTLLVTRSRQVRDGGLDEQYVVRSYDRGPVRFRLVLRAAADLAEMAEVKSGARPAPLPALPAPSGLRWSGREGAAVVLAADPAPHAVDPDRGRLSWDLDVEPDGALTVSLRASLVGEGAVASVVRQPGGGLVSLRAPLVQAVDPRLGRFLERSVADLDSLRLVTSERPEDVFLAAGVPWFLTLFGRDSIWAARMLLPLGTELALGTLRTLAACQGRAHDSRTGEEPGKILHELRAAAASHELWRSSGSGRLDLPSAYYGTVDASLLWVCLLHDAWMFGAGEAAVERLLAPMLRCLVWLGDALEAGDGFVSYVDKSGNGLSNQGWKDSHDGIQFRDGRIAAAPLALCEVQAYAYEAAVSGARLLDAFGRSGSARLVELAASLAERFRRRFWVEDDHGPYPAVAIDGSGEAVDSLASNIGHLLGTGLLAAGEEQLVARRLGSPELDSGFGLRTLATSAAGFNPLSYHGGSVWAHDTAIAVAGLTRATGDAARLTAASLIEGLLAAAESFEHRMPELYGGHARLSRGGPDPYPASCRPQAWSAASSVAVLSCLLGLRPDLPARRVRLAPLESEVCLAAVSGLRLGHHELSLRLDREGSVEVAGIPAEIEVVVER